MYFVIRKSSDGQFYWAAVGDNHQDMAISETMTRKESCKDAIAVIKQQAASAPVIDMSLPAPPPT